MRFDRILRPLLPAVLLLITSPLLAQTPAPDPNATSVGGGLFEVSNGLIYAMLALAIMQTIFIVSLSGVMRTMGGVGAWARRYVRNAGKIGVLLPLLLLASDANAQTYKGDGGVISNYHLFWALLAVNLVLLTVMIAQLIILKGLTKAVTGVKDEVEASEPEGPTWVDTLLQRLTRRPAVEKEQDLLMHHEYDGIRELDNVLPPWWVWLFYGTILWGLVYLVNVHMLGVWPEQEAEYAASMQQAKEEVAAFVALQGSVVDETNVTASTDAAIINSGEAIFSQFCVACHNAGGQGSETSVGPNLTDAYWIHGGGVKNIFKTIKYGVPAKGMISWKSQLKPNEIAALASYILSREGKGDASQKAPQGDLWKEAAAPVDSTAAPADSLAAPADTARLATN